MLLHAMDNMTFDINGQSFSYVRDVTTVYDILNSECAIYKSKN
jgi:hypothetical protein